MSFKKYNSKSFLLMKNNIKKVIVHVWEWLYLKGAFPGLQKKAVIFMLHRMSSPNVIEEGHSEEFLDQALKHLSRKGYNFVSIEDIYKNINDGNPPLKKAIAFTIDDGFADQAEIAAPIFIKHRCPATIFLITGFVNGENQPWDAFVKYVFYKTDKSQIKPKLNSEVLLYDLDSAERKYSAMRDFRNKCKSITELEMKKAIDSLVCEADIGNIVHPIPGIQALSWDQARELEKSGISFGPHTISHSILSKCNNERASVEINGSWSMLTQQLEKPCPVFAYPTGRREDFSVRDIKYIKEIGLLGALTAEPGLVSFNDVTEADKYLLKRMSFPSNIEDLIQYTSGFELIKQSFRNFKLKLKFTRKVNLLSNIGIIIKYHLGYYNQYNNIDWPRVSRIIFVCKGNICRSPYAEMRAKQLGINATSLGLSTKEGSFANADAIKNALYRDVNLESHRARVYESIKLSNRDLVICMEPWHVKIFKEFDSSGCQITLLGLLCSQKKIVISDPYGKPDLFFNNCFQAIDNALNNVKKHYQSIK